MEFAKTATRYLKHCGIKISVSFVRERIQSHPDYPAFVSLTDSLDELGLPNTAFVCDKHQYAELHYPLLAHLNKNGGDFIVINSPAIFASNKNAVHDLWDGVCLYVEKKSIIQNQEHNERLLTEKKEFKKQAFAVMAMACLLLVMTGIYISIFFVIFQLLSRLGIAICSLIVLHSFGEDNIITEQLCATDSNHGCDTVLQSKAGSWKGISLGDVGLTYFTGSSIFLALTASTTALAGTGDILSILSAIGLLVAITSSLYQWLIVKAWCTMCLIVDTILALQAVLTYFFIKEVTALHMTYTGILLFAFSLLLIALIWSYYKKLLQKIASAAKREIKAIRFRRSPTVFLAMLHQQRMVDTTIWDDDIVLGNAQAPLQLVIACNPYCHPCAQTHKEIEKLLRSYYNEIGIIVRFTIKSNDTADKKNIAVRHIIKAWRNGHKKAVDIWFEKMNIADFKDLYPGEPDDILLHTLLDRYAIWTKESSITHTPTIFVNGRELPKQYQLADLKIMLIQLTENITALSVVANTENVV
jgi:uncharacterized membrane protein